jgi:hypothetical protein
VKAPFPLSPRATASPARIDELARVLALRVLVLAAVALATDDGGYAINQVEGPDEHHWPVDNEVYTNVGAITTMRLATRVAQMLGEPPNPAWTTVADGLPVLLDPVKLFRLSSRATPATPSSKPMSSCAPTRGSGRSRRRSA